MYVLVLYIYSGGLKFETMKLVRKSLRDLAKTQVEHTDFVPRIIVRDALFGTVRMHESNRDVRLREHRRLRKQHATRLRI